MLNPCVPCICSFSCDLCVFNNTTLEKRQEELVWFIENCIEDDGCEGWKIARAYKHFNKNWEKELEEYKGGSSIC